MRVTCHFVFKFVRLGENRTEGREGGGGTKHVGDEADKKPLLEVLVAALPRAVHHCKTMQQTESGDDSEKLQRHAARIFLGSTRRRITRRVSACRRQEGGSQRHQKNQPQNKHFEGGRTTYQEEIHYKAGGSFLNLEGGGRQWRSRRSFGLQGGEGGRELVPRLASRRSLLGAQ